MSDRDDERPEEEEAGRRALRLLLLGGGAGLLAGGLHLGVVGPPDLYRLGVYRVAGALVARPPWVGPGAVLALALDRAPDLAPGETFQLRVDGLTADGSLRDVAAGARFTSLDASIASVSTTGLVTARAPGETTIVVGHVDPTAGQVPSIGVPVRVGRDARAADAPRGARLLPDDGRAVLVGAPLQLVLRGDDGRDLTAGARFEVEGPGEVDAAGVVVPRGPGALRVVARLQDLVAEAAFEAVPPDGSPGCEEPVR
ncbi:MAG: Ig-like domain-containing protein [Planctomycetes bacterium]|nr:Ig-like domain-containing protein [Planctomycetota bacterium]